MLKYNNKKESEKTLNEIATKYELLPENLQTGKIQYCET